MLGEVDRNELLEGEGDGERNDALDGDGERNDALVDGDVGSYTGGGTKLAFTREWPFGAEPASMAAWRSEA